MNNEFEVKFLSIDKDLLKKKIIKFGFSLLKPEFKMRRKTFDFSNVRYKKWARVREESDKITMTIKEVRGKNINDVFEIEIIVNDFEKACNFLTECGLKEKALQENYREIWILSKNNYNIELMIDTWPGLNPFVEIEGRDINKLKEVSEKLGFNFKEAVFGSIDLVYEKELGIFHKDIINLPEISFKNFPQKNTV